MTQVNAIVNALLIHTANVLRPTESVSNGVTNLSYTASTGVPCHIQGRPASERALPTGYELDGDWWGFFNSTAPVQVGDLVRATSGSYSGKKWWVRNVHESDVSGVEHLWTLLEITEEST